jgi:hypothetical protein
MKNFSNLNKSFLQKEKRELWAFIIAEKLASFFYPQFTYTDYGKIWLEDKGFFRHYEKYNNGNDYRSADRKYFLRELLSLIEHLPGDTVECGVYCGATSELICEKFKETPKIHHAFDSFEGLSQPLAPDGNAWRKGDLKVAEDIVRKNLASFEDKVIIYKGWIPERFSEVSNKKFCFVHIDVDLYQPTLDSLRFFYPRLVSGGIIMCDDYGFSTCPGAKKAFDEYIEDKPESIVHVPTGQGFLVKR